MNIFMTTPITHIDLEETYDLSLQAIIIRQMFKKQLGEIVSNINEDEAFKYFAPHLEELRSFRVNIVASKYGIEKYCQTNKVGHLINLFKRVITNHLYTCSFNILKNSPRIILKCEICHKIEFAADEEDTKKLKADGYFFLNSRYCTDCF